MTLTNLKHWVVEATLLTSLAIAYPFAIIIEIWLIFAGQPKTKGDKS